VSPLCVSGVLCINSNKKEKASAAAAAASNECFQLNVQWPLDTKNLAKYCENIWSYHTSTQLEFPMGSSQVKFGLKINYLKSSKLVFILKTL